MVDFTSRILQVFVCVEREPSEKLVVVTGLRRLDYRVMRGDIERWKDKDIWEDKKRKKPRQKRSAA